MNLRTFLLSYFIIFLLSVHWLGEKALAISAPISLILSIERRNESFGEILAKEILLLLFPPKYRYKYKYAISPREGILEILTSLPSGLIEVREEEISCFPEPPFEKKVQKIYLYTKEEVSEWLRSNGIQFTRLYP